MKIDLMIVFCEALVLAHIGVLINKVIKWNSTWDIVALAISIVASVIILVCFIFDIRVKYKKAKIDKNADL